MKRRDLLSSIIWCVFGALFTLGSIGHGLMRNGIPGPGFLPFFTGIALIFASLFVLIPAVRKREKSKEPLFPVERGTFKKILFALVALVAYGMIMQYVGFFLTTLLFMLFVPRLMNVRWPTVALLAIITAVASYLLFVVLLELQLPRGFLDF
jgi:putative tricarboxylic transport membrane protein